MLNFKKIAIAMLGVFLFSGVVQANNKYVTASNVEPQRPLIPGDTIETGGGTIIGLLYSGLKHYDENGVAHNDIAESITSEDKQHYVVKIRDDAKFSDGSPVQAKHFVNAWNLVIKNKLSTYDFFSAIAGYPKADEQVETLSGLKIVDDKTFTIDLTHAIADFENRLGSPAFMPLGDGAFTDLKAYGQNPVANGPYKLESEKAWKHNIGMTLVVNEHYIGPRKAKNAGVKFNFYAKLTAGYADLLSDKLDVLHSMPDEALLTAEYDLGERFIVSPVAIWQGIVLNVNTLKHFKLDEEGLLRRKAISMAINRPEITKIIFNNTRTPARDFTAPVIPSYNPQLKGAEALDFNPEEAKRLWAEAEKIAKYTDTFSISYNADGGHQNWVDAVTNQIKNTLGIKAVGKPYPDFKSMLDDARNRRITGAQRTGWSADYPAADNFLAAMFLTKAKVASNDSDYNNPEFDNLVLSATTAKTQAENFAYIKQAQELLLRDLPSIPLWYANGVIGHSKKVSNVKIGWDDTPLYHEVIKK